MISEQWTDSWGERFTTEWHCDPPAIGVLYRVVRQEWAEDYTVRRIFEVVLV